MAYQTPLLSLYLAIRTDGLTGTGTATDPYNANTPTLLDTIVNGAAANAEIFLSPGSYTTGGLLLKAGQSLIGSGMGDTTLKLASGAGGNEYQISVISGEGDGILVQGMKVDADSETLLPANRKIYNLVTLTGSYCTIRDIHGVNPYGDRTLAWLAGSPCQSPTYRETHHTECDAMRPSEGFAIYIGGPYYTSESTPPTTNALIEHCVVEKIHGDYVNAICLLKGGIAADLPVSGTITNCTVDGNPWIAYAANAGLITNNLCTNCACFWRSDTGSVNDLLIIGNKAIDCTKLYVLEWKPSLYPPPDGNWGSNFVIQGNIFTYAEDATAPSQAFYFDDMGAPGSFDGVTISDNIIYYKAPPEVGFFGIAASFYKNVTVTNNISNGGPIYGPPGDRVYADSHVISGNVVNGIDTGLNLAPGANLSEYRVGNDWPLSGGSAGLGAYFVGLKRGGIDWQVQGDGNTAWALRSLMGGTLGTPIYGDQYQNVYIPGVLAIGSAMCHLQSGTGSPEGVLSAPAGSLYLQTNGSLPALYVKQSGATATGWDTVQIPSGTVCDFAGNTDSSVPNGWLLCYGQAVSRTTYARLFTAISTTYGIGDGSTTFNLPDCRGRVAAGKDNMGGTSAGNLTSATILPNAISLNGKGGSENVLLNSTQIPAHSHPITYPVNSYVYALSNNNNATTTGTGLRTTGGSLSTLPPGTGNNTGGGAAHANVQPTIILNKIIKA